MGPWRAEPWRRAIVRERRIRTYTCSTWQGACGTPGDRDLTDMWPMLAAERDDKRTSDKGHRGPGRHGGEGRSLPAARSEARERVCVLSTFFGALHSRARKLRPELRFKALNKAAPLREVSNVRSTRSYPCQGSRTLSSLGSRRIQQCCTSSSQCCLRSWSRSAVC